MSPGDPPGRPESAVSRLPSTDELVTLGAPMILRDGSTVRIRPGHSTDRDLLLRGFARLSPESRYRRFLAATPELSSAMVDYLTSVDHHDHEAIVALDESGEGIGVARYVRHAARTDAAEGAVTVVDDWQGRGVGTLLLEVLCARAREEGITTLTAVMLAGNQEMMDLIAALAPVRIVDREAGTVEVEVPIPVVGLPPALRKLLRVAAEHDVVVPHRGFDPGRRGSMGADAS
jgi:GNAT superfamily N-acetyltransferase